jgi:hypothetical protein
VVHRWQAGELFNAGDEFMRRGHDRGCEQVTKGFTAVGLPALTLRYDLVDFYVRDKNPVFIKDLQAIRQLSTARRG